MNVRRSEISAKCVCSMYSTAVQCHSEFHRVIVSLAVGHSESHRVIVSFAEAFLRRVLDVDKTNLSKDGNTVLTVREFNSVD